MPSKKTNTVSLPITDSPWFWLTLFSAVGLAALLATGGKFGKRQSGIERRYQARDWQARALERENGPEKAVGENPQAEPGKAAVPDYSTPEKTIVGLWPLACVLGALCVTSLVLLVYTHLAKPF
jgi:hypothetical protein